MAHLYMELITDGVHSGRSGVGYNLHNEKFMEGASFVDLLKIRGSIGTTGGQNFNPYQSMAMYSYNDSRINAGFLIAGYMGAITESIRE